MKVKTSVRWVGLVGAALFVVGCAAAPMAPPQVTSASLRPAPPPIEARDERAPGSAGVALRAPTEGEARSLRESTARAAARCYKDWLATAPITAESFAFDVVFGTDGATSTVRPVASSVALPWVACLAREMGTLRLVAPPTVRVAARLPIELAPPPAAPPEPTFAPAAKVARRR